MLQGTQAFLSLRNYANDASVQSINNNPFMLGDALTQVASLFKACSLPLNLPPDDRRWHKALVSSHKNSMNRSIQNRGQTHTHKIPITTHTKEEAICIQFKALYHLHCLNLRRVMYTIFFFLKSTCVPLVSCYRS